MSHSDSFIEEVTEEVRRDRLFALMRRYGWIAVLAVLLLVGGAAWNEWRKAQETRAARAFGDSLLAALERSDPAARLAALEAIEAPGPGGAAVLALLKAGEQAAAGEDAAAVKTLQAVPAGGLPPVYGQIAAFKALVRQGDAVPAEERRLAFGAIATPGAPLRLLAEEQLALLDIEAGETEAALDRLAALRQDAEATAGLRRRAAQLMVALGRDPQAQPSEG